MHVKKKTNFLFKHSKLKGNCTQQMLCMWYIFAFEMTENLQKKISTLEKLMCIKGLKWQV